MATIQIHGKLLYDVRSPRRRSSSSHKLLGVCSPQTQPGKPVVVTPSPIRRNESCFNCGGRGHTGEVILFIFEVDCGLLLDALCGSGIF